MSRETIIWHQKRFFDIHFKPENVFLVLSLIFGSLFCLAVAPFQVADEFAHFYRAYQVSLLEFIPEIRSEYDVGGQLPQSFLQLEESFHWMITNPKSAVPVTKLKELLRQPLEPQQTQFFNFKNSATYTPIGYLPQALGLLVGRILGVSLLAEFYLGRIFNLLAFITLTYISIRVMPLLKWVLLMIALMPMTIHQAASLSVDALLNGLSFLFIGLVVRLAFKDDRTPVWKDIWTWILLLCLITLIKPAYIAIGALLLIIPRKKFGSWKTYLLALVLAIGVPLLVYVAWVQFLSSNAITMSATDQFNAQRQTQWMMNNILSISKILILTYLDMALPLIISLIGYFGWLTQPQPVFVYPLFIAFGLITLILDNNYPQVHVLFWQRVITLVVIAFNLLLVATAIYIVGNPTGYYRIAGIQGRYLIPLVLLFNIMMYTNIIRIPGWFLKILVPIFSSSFLVIALQTVSQRIHF